MTIELPLITKYRPQEWEELVGNETMIASLRKVISDESRPHAYLLVGPAGTGKTTIARIIAAEVQADLVEIDAASYSGVEDARNLVELGQHRSLTGSGKKLFLIDECHAMSKAAWQALLKLLEEPPEHLYLALCTTEIPKVPETIKQRCFNVLLRPVPPNEILDLLEAVAHAEGWQVADDVMEAVVQAGNGSPRKSLSILQAVHDAPNRDEVRRIIVLQDNSEPVTDIIKHLLSGAKSWPFIQARLLKIDDTDFENGLISMCRYILAYMNNAADEKTAMRGSVFLECLLQPSVLQDPKSIFYAAVTRMLWAQ